MKNLLYKFTVWLFPFDDLIPKDLFIWITPQDESLKEYCKDIEFFNDTVRETLEVPPEFINCRCMGE